MRVRYKLPIMGTALKDEPLQGKKEDPLAVIPIQDLAPKRTVIDPDTEQEHEVSKFDFSFDCLDYNIAEEWCEVEVEAEQGFHDWLAGILPQLNDIKKAKGWKLDKSKLEKVK